jgi:hypothetical protein
VFGKREFSFPGQKRKRLKLNNLKGFTDRTTARREKVPVPRCATLMTKPILYIKLARVGNPAVIPEHWDGVGLPAYWQSSQRPPMPPVHSNSLSGFAQFQLFEDDTFAGNILGFVYRSNIQGYGGFVAVYNLLSGRVASFDKAVAGMCPVDSGPQIPYGAPANRDARVYNPNGASGVFKRACISTLPSTSKGPNSQPIDLQYAEPGISFLRDYFELHVAYPLYDAEHPADGNGGAPHDPAMDFIVVT